MLSPFAGREFAGGLDGFAESFGPLGFFFHRFSESAAVEFLRGIDAEDAKHSWRNVDIRARQTGRHTLTKIGAGGDEGVVHVELAQGRVAAFAGTARAVGNDLARSAEAVWL